MVFPNRDPCRLAGSIGSPRICRDSGRPKTVTAWPQIDDIFANRMHGRPPVDDDGTGFGIEPSRRHGGLTCREKFASFRPAKHGAEALSRNARQFKGCHDHQEAWSSLTPPAVLRHVLRRIGCAPPVESPWDVCRTDTPEPYGKSDTNDWLKRATTFRLPRVRGTPPR